VSASAWVRNALRCIFDLVSARPLDTAAALTAHESHWLRLKRQLIVTTSQTSSSGTTKSTRVPATCYGINLTEDAVG
jgi:hypothetical protein